MNEEARSIVCKKLKDYELERDLEFWRFHRDEAQKGLDRWKPQHKEALRVDLMWRLETSKDWVEAIQTEQKGRSDNE